MIDLFLGAFAGFVVAALGFGWALHRRELAGPVEVVRLVETDRVEVWRDGLQVYAGPDRRRRGVEDSEAYRWPDGRREGEAVEEFDAVRAMAQKAREENEALKARLDAMEAGNQPS